ncbi:MAG: homocysteine S-methyltransferase family protein [Planctomycetota bacterium]
MTATLQQDTPLRLKPGRKRFLDVLAERVLVMDGAMGSALQEFDLDLEKDWMGQENMSEVLNFSRPDVIKDIHKGFLEIGCDAVESNTFGGNRIVMAEADMVDKAYEVSRLGAEIARDACNEYETDDCPRFVVGSIGPGTKLISLGNCTWEEMEQSYYENVLGLIDGGADVLLIETCQDLLQIKCCLSSIDRACEERGLTGLPIEGGDRPPIMVQLSMDLNAGQSMLMGSDSQTALAALLPYDQIDVLGLNCATGPVELTEHIRYFSRHWPRYISCLPNAGMPIMVDGKSEFPLGPADFAKGLLRFVDEFDINIVGGCCGTKVPHLKAVLDGLVELG